MSTLKNVLKKAKSSSTYYNIILPQVLVRNARSQSSSTYYNIILPQVLSSQQTPSARHWKGHHGIHTYFQPLQSCCGEGGKLKTTALQIITYGLTSSSFLATRYLVELAHHWRE